MAGGLDDLKTDLNELTKRIEDLKKLGLNIDTRPMEDALKRVQSDTKNVGSTTTETAEKIKTSSGVIVNAFGGINSTLGGIAQAILAAGQGAQTMGEQFRQAFSGNEFGKAAEGFDELTAMTRSLRTSAVDVGSAFGLSFDQVKTSYQNYNASVLLAQENTYETRQAIQEYTKALAQLGIGLDEMGSVFDVAGVKQNMLSTGFLLAADSGLNASTVFGLMAAATRQMGLSAETAGRPLVALENLARDTGLPISQLANRTFDTAREFSRLGLTVDGISPIMRRFVDTLGPGFKGLAIDETTKLINGLERQINTTQAAFIAMEGGLARPGAGVAEAQLAFEDAFKNPIEIVKSLQTTLSGVTGGKIIKFEEARANPELANQFKIQRDLLAQLTGNTDPQSQRTLMSILSDLQNGRQLTANQTKTIEDSLKSGTQKQEEVRGIQDRLGKLQVGLLSQIALNTSSFFDKLLPAQVQAGATRKIAETAGGVEKEAIDFISKKAIAIGSSLLENSPALKKTMDVAGNIYGAAEEKSATLRQAPEDYTMPSLQDLFSASRQLLAPALKTEMPNLAQPSPAFVSPSATPTTAGKTTEKIVNEPGKHDGNNMTITIKATDDIGRAIANAIMITYNNTLHGGG